LEASFNTLLRGWRARRGYSQYALALDAGVSSKHLSFLETERAHPSREMVLRLAGVLDLPLRERNTLLLSAGFAPRFGERPWTSREMEEALRAVRLMLDAHEPYPAFALDRYWNIVLWNDPLVVMLSDVAEDGSIDRINALDLVFQPGLMRERFVNWEEVAVAVLKRLRRQIARAAEDEKLQELWRRVREAPGVAGLIREGHSEEVPPILVPMKIREEDGQVLTWINTLAVFGATGDVTLDELVVESFFPADGATRRFVEQAVTDAI